MSRTPLRRRLAALATSGVLAGGAVLAGGSPSQAADGAAEALKTRSLATVLAADGARFDRNAQDFDVLERAVGLVLEARPGSRVGVLADGSRRTTAFLPTDQAFTRLVADLTGERPGSERATFRAVRSLGVPTVNDVLLYHVLPGRTLTSEKVLAARGTRVGTALGAPIRVTVRNGDVLLGDRDFNDPNPQVVVLDINRGNRQVGHAIDRVLRPADL